MGIEIMKNGDVVPVWKVPELIETLETEIGRLHAENERLRKEAKLGKDLARHIRNLPTAELDSDALILAHKVLGSKAP